MSQFRQGNKVIAAANNALICPQQLLLKREENDVHFTPDSFILRGFNRSLVAKNQQKTIPYDLAIKYQKYMRCLFLWFGGIISWTFYRGI